MGHVAFSRTDPSATVFASAGMNDCGAQLRAGKVAVLASDPPNFAIAANDPFVCASVDHAAAPLRSSGIWNGKLFMTCINLSYPDGSGPDDPGGNRSSSIHPKLRARRHDGWLLR